MLYFDVSLRREEKAGGCSLKGIKNQLQKHSSTITCFELLRPGLPQQGVILVSYCFSIFWVDKVRIEEFGLGEALGDVCMVDGAEIAFGFGGGDIAAFLWDDSEFAFVGGELGSVVERTHLLNRLTATHRLQLLSHHLFYPKGYDPRATLPPISPTLSFCQCQNLCPQIKLIPPSATLIITIRYHSMKAEQTNSFLWQTNCISVLSFSPDAAYCAVATKQDHVVHLYRVGTLAQVDSWVLLQEFKELTQTVSDIDWSSDRKIITASHDRSVVVWRQVGESRWEKMLVNIDIKLSILVARWAPSARKFAMGSACNTLAISYYNNEENCWVITSKGNLTRAPITTLSFHPSSNLLAIGSADFSVRIVTSSFRGSKDPLIINSKVEDYQYAGPFKNVESMFEVLFTVENLGGWINYVSFENGGSSLLVLPHSNHFKIYDIAESANLVVGEEDVQWNGLPFLSGYVGPNKELLLGGFNKKVARFAKKGKYSFEGYLTVNEKTNAVKSKKSNVSNFTKNIEANKSIYNEGPAETDHVNSIKTIQVRGAPASYDGNGVIHFWSG